jgi:hypothetical protein
MSGPARMVKLADLWQRKSTKGTVYFSGFMGDCQILLFKDGKKPHPTRPNEAIIVWKLLVQERDPERRPHQRERPPAAEAARGQQTNEALEAVARNWNESERDRHVQELAEQFDQRPPDEVPF